MVTFGYIWLNLIKMANLTNFDELLLSMAIITLNGYFETL